MMRSLFSGVSGLRVHQTKMDVIANNISNVNTVGYKSSRTIFSDVFYQRLQGASGPNPQTGRAGTNPMQIGLGSNVASIDNIMSQGPSQRTDNAMDIMIQGNGFFIVKDATGVYFTRAGNINRDFQNNLHINGMQLMGWDSIENKDTGKYEIQTGSVQPLSLSGKKQYVPPEATSLVDVKGNLNAIGEPVAKRTMEIYDSVGNLYTVDVEFTYRDDLSDHGDSYWDMTFLEDGHKTAGGYVTAYPNNDRTNPKTIAIDILTADVGDSKTSDDMSKTVLLNFDTNGSFIGYGARPPAPGEQDWVAPAGKPETLKFSEQGQPRISLVAYPIDVLDPTATFGSDERYNVNYDPADGAGYAESYASHAGTIQLDFSEFRQYEGENPSARFEYANGNTPGELQDISVGPDGKLTGRYSNGMTRLLGQIPVAQFANPAGLEKVGNNLYAATVNSGPFNGIGTTGEIMGGALEMSNVDLSQEFTDMITTQRGFQANSRVITTSDDMLQELVNLKR